MAIPLRERLWERRREGAPRRREREPAHIATASDINEREWQKAHSSLILSYYWRLFEQMAVLEKTPARMYDYGEKWRVYSSTNRNPAYTTLIRQYINIFSGSLDRRSALSRRRQRLINKQYFMWHQTNICRRPFLTSRLRAICGI